MLDELQIVNPDFLEILQLEDLEASCFVEQEYQRPPGYSATTRLHAGRLCIPMLNDTGATCSCMTEEMAVMLVNHTWKMLDQGLMDEKAYNYPIVKMFHYKNSAKLKGAEKNGRMLVEYAMIVRMEFIPEYSESGPTKDIYFKIFNFICF